MYQSVDAVNQGHLFWRSVAQAWPLPFRIDTAAAAVLSFEREPFGVVCWANDSLKDRRVIHFSQSEELVLEVVLTRDMEFIYAVSLGITLDEVTAVSAVRLFAPEGLGVWSLQGELTIAEDEDYV